MGKDKSTPTLAIPPFLSLEKRDWVQMTLQRIKACPYFLVLYCPINNTLTEAKATRYVTEDTTLSAKFLKVFDAATTKLLTLERK
eukprot:3519696-Ditylum_brightwellii.AAC.1